MDWEHFSARHGHFLMHYLNLIDEADQARRIRAVLAGRPRKAPFVAPVLAALGRRLVRWGTWLQYNTTKHGPLL